MEAWVQQDFTPVAQDADGNDIYGYICLAPQDEVETNDLIEFLENHGVPIDWGEE